MIWIVVLLLSVCFFDLVHKYKDKCILKPDTNNQSRAPTSPSKKCSIEGNSLKLDIKSTLIAKD